MRKFLTSVFVVFVGASVFGVTTAVAQNKSELPIFVAEDSNSVCQPGLVNLSEMAGKVKAHSIRLNELECWGNDMGNKVRLLANQADEASQKTTAENKTVAEELQKQTKAADAKVRRLRQQIKEIREIQGGSAFAQRLRQVLMEEGYR